MLCVAVRAGTTMDAVYLAIALAFFGLSTVCVRRVFPEFQP